MAATEGLMTLGSWSLNLVPETPQAVLDAILDFGCVTVHPTRQTPQLAGDGLLASARYVGVVRDRRFTDDTRKLGGPGTAWWLGDEAGTGPNIEAPIALSRTRFNPGIRSLLPPAVTAGTLHGVGGSFTGSLGYQSRRTALSTFCSFFSNAWGEAEWRVNGDGTLDAGYVDQLYHVDPVAVVARDLTGADLQLRGLSGQGTTSQDMEDFTTRVVVLDGTGDTATAIGEAALPLHRVPYLDLHGNRLTLTRFVTASSGALDADAAAQVQLNRLNSPRTTVTLDTAELDVQGVVRVGDYVHVWDPLAGLVDRASDAAEVSFRGRRINPVGLRVTEMTWPFLDGMGVAYRDYLGTWTDLTDYMQWENSAAQITVGDLPRGLLTGLLTAT